MSSVPRGAAGPPSDPSAEHYSYRHYRDAGVAERFDQLRFGGPIGELLLEAQERVLQSAFAPCPGRRVLDVGTGTGRAALALGRTGAAVTGVDASPEMLAVAKRRAEAQGLDVSFDVADAHHLPYPDAAFDGAVSLRVLMHTPDWRQCLGELCRVSRWRVVFDFPAASSAAALESGARRVWQALGGRTEAYRVMAARTVVRELARHDFRVVDLRRQFVLPIAWHKRVGSRRWTEAVERPLARLGVLDLCGSPVTVVAERTGDGRGGDANRVAAARRDAEA